MNLGGPMQQLVQAIVTKGRPQDFIWAIEPESFQRYLSQSVEAKIEEVAGVESNGTTAVIHINGVMTRFVNDRISQAIIDAATDSSIDRIELRMDTPGGTVSGLAEAGDAIQMARQEKPIDTIAEGMIASAGYYLAAQTNSITARRMDVIGSIGTRLALMETKGLAEMIGMRPIIVDTGEFKSLGAFGTEVTDNQVEHLQELVDAFFADFREAVVTGRGARLKSFDAVANGKIWTAQQALQLGLIDQIASPVKATGEAGRSVNSGDKKLSTDNKTQPATFKELKEALPNASAEFICDQQENEATIEQAKDAWTNHLAEENARIAKENEELKSKQKEQESAAKKSGVKKDELAGTDNAKTPDAPFNRETYYQYVGEVAQKEFSHLPPHKRRYAAVAKIMREHPEACEAMRTAG